jgi:hypothetical protein
MRTIATLADARAGTAHGAGEPSASGARGGVAALAPLTIRPPGRNQGKVPAARPPHGPTMQLRPRNSLQSGLPALDGKARLKPGPFFVVDGPRFNSADK